MHSLLRKARNLKLKWALTLLLFLLSFAILLLGTIFRHAELIGRRATASGSCKDCLDLQLPPTPGKGLNCSLIIRGDRRSLEQASKTEMVHRHQPTTEADYLNQSRDCRSFRERRRFLPKAPSGAEENFPLAFSMVIHDNIEMFERLLRALYVPQNLYCVHVDAKSPPLFQEAVRVIASCFDNVFVASKLEPVLYSSWSRVQADLNCMEDLLKSPVPWRYLLNAASTDFPIKTNAEMVRALRALDGCNSLESQLASELKKWRWQRRHEVRDSIFFETQVSKAPPPINSPMFTGSAYFVVSRRFVRALFEDPWARELLEWDKDTFSPEEHLWATLQRMPGMPGSIPSSAKHDVSDMKSLARLVKWKDKEGDVNKGASYPPCTGVHRRSVCIYGAGDLHWMLQQHHLLANQFDPSVDDTVIQCLEEHLRNKALKERQP
ncbi:beta-1,3-galactosyl-O-glycosyl-glycoprotein beta-1,6-N-acetylglucosaminyltransferase 3-like [Ambystoma mexicanum]|uniref:beta-1,3-galactosyl-O-glycosyl-glycoprotein beta-1,6-N-acetylglucosaminyltransferase 3-like n=1 Tax=Ambystoma mexicanum TaxID=8296 RepID=UPI0037E70AB8